MKMNPNSTCPVILRYFTLSTALHHERRRPVAAPKTRKPAHRGFYLFPAFASLPPFSIRFWGEFDAPSVRLPAKTPAMVARLVRGRDRCGRVCGDLAGDRGVVRHHAVLRRLHSGDPDREPGRRHAG